MNIFVLVLVYKYSHGRETKVVVVHALLIKGVEKFFICTHHLSFRSRCSADDEIFLCGYLISLFPLFDRKKAKERRDQIFSFFVSFFRPKKF
jgi:hypothetical protein